MFDKWLKNNLKIGILKQKTSYQKNKLKFLDMESYLKPDIVHPIIALKLDSIWIYSLASSKAKFKLFNKEHINMKGYGNIMFMNNLIITKDEDFWKLGDFLTDQEGIEKAAEIFKYETTGEMEIDLMKTFKELYASFIGINQDDPQNLQIEILNEEGSIFLQLSTKETIMISDDFTIYGSNFKKTILTKTEADMLVEKENLNQFSKILFSEEGPTDLLKLLKK